MYNHIDIEFMRRLAPQLEQFKEKGNHLFNFRCPYCGDSKTSKVKARGYVFQKKNDFFYKCHNCSVGKTLSNLIKYVDADLHKEYVMARYTSGVHSSEKPTFDFKPPEFNTHDQLIFEDFLYQLKTFDDLKTSSHPAVKFVEQRKIPEKYYSQLYFAPEFFKFTNTLLPNKFPSLSGDHPRLIIPFFDKENVFFGYQGRAFGKENPKYITIMLKEKNKIFGLDRINSNQHIFVVEGPIDSLFLDNCLAVAGADFKLDMDEKDYTVIYDNEPRNVEIIKRMEKSIEQNQSIVIWPDNIEEKDINDMILSGKTSVEIHRIISKNTFSNLHAKTRLINWKKI